jgi:hypothetical protein
MVTAKMEEVKHAPVMSNAEYWTSVVPQNTRNGRNENYEPS